MPAPVQQAATGVIDGRLYVFGGWSSVPTFNAIHDEVQVFDSASQAWSLRTPMPTRRHWATCSVVDGRAFVIGGETGGHSTGWTQPSRKVEMYDPDSDTWTAKANMPTARWGATSQTVGGLIYVIGGSNAFSHYRTVEAYDPSTDTWSTKADMPTGRTAAASVTSGGRIYVIGGDSTTIHSQVEVYNPSANTWSTGSALPEPRGTPGAALLAGQIYVIGGHPLTDDVGLAGVYIYDIVQGLWRTGPSLQTGRGTPGVVVLESAIYAVGGGNPPLSTLGSIEVLR
jgi:N-acetylneuraminic acid mutarotase